MLARNVTVYVLAVTAALRESRRAKPFLACAFPVSATSTRSSAAMANALRGTHRTTSRRRWLNQFANRADFPRWALYLTNSKEQVL
ncbi:hypothetical protein CC78DRAFT_579541 [Lojkania enalia]|uniref:Uncharacterized protein n=1 Tax=Lojkania enalia TaxID=147567 RepID=A0A9P4K9C9_9PLEO|nr:hypothetical protein CC78DRAFT_579541 [Didymosphaeria enalia]